MSRINTPINQVRLTNVAIVRMTNRRVSQQGCQLPLRRWNWLGRSGKPWRLPNIQYDSSNKKYEEAIFGLFQENSVRAFYYWSEGPRKKSREKGTDAFYSLLEADKQLPTQLLNTDSVWTILSEKYVTSSTATRSHRPPVNLAASLHL